MEKQSGNMERAVKHWIIAASAGDFCAMHNLLVALKNGAVSRESSDSTLKAYNDCCAEMEAGQEMHVFNSECKYYSGNLKLKRLCCVLECLLLFVILI